MAIIQPDSDTYEAHLQLAESAKTMTSTAFWQKLVVAHAEDEAECLRDMERYLTENKYPDDHDLASLVKKWFAIRQYRRTEMGNVNNYARLSQAQEVSAVPGDDMQSVIGEM